ncbi:MAG: 4-hydroxy-tetrahydrodipicolinate reductase [Bacillota bacterium]|nr:4-hydroxy-tetrahydrodipicolinate reductase [Bacillota bacterium]
MSIRVAVSGITGRTGRWVAQGITETTDMELVGGVALHHGGRDLEQVLGIPGPAGKRKVFPSLEELLQREEADVLVDFTLAEAASSLVPQALSRGLSVVSGTTGLQEEDLALWDRQARRSGKAVIHVPNFSLGALILERMAVLASRWLPQAEVVEIHHPGKKDRPSGTALALKEAMEEAGAQGPVPLHSLRLPGWVAHHRVFFGSRGETLTLSHDVLSREAFVPGVLVAVRGAVRVERPGLYRDLWPFLEGKG